MNTLRWLGVHYKHPEEEHTNNTDSDTSSESDTEEEEGQSEGEEESKEEEAHETARETDDEVRGQGCSTKTVDNEKKRYNTALNTHKSKLRVLEDRTKWLQEFKTNDEIANWPGHTIPYLPQTCKTAAVSAFKTIMDQLPRRDQNDPASFSRQQWEDPVSNAPRLSAAGGGGLRPDYLHTILKYCPDTAQVMYE